MEKICSKRIDKIYRILFLKKKNGVEGSISNVEVHLLSCDKVCQ